ncbi:transposase [Bradyrhizobium sp. JR6.1]
MGVLQAPAPAQAIDGGMVTEVLLAHIAVMKYGYQLPLYRQEQMFAAQGITLDRQTLASWMGRVAWWPKPLHALLRRAVMSYPRLFADETPLPVLDPGRGRTKVCQFWAIATDDRPWGGPGAAGSGLRVRRGSQGDPRQAAVWRLRRHPAGRWLCRLQGPDQERRPSDATCVLLRACAAEVLGRSRRDEVADCRGSAAADRDVLRHRGSHSRFAGDAASYGARQSDTRPLIEDFKPWLEARLLEVSKKSGLGKAIRYTLNHWHGLTRFIDDGRIEIDSNTVERSIKPIGLGKKNYLFAGSEGGAETWGILASLINTAKLHDMDPRHYLTDVLERIVSGRTKINQLHLLLPWNWKAERDGSEAKLAA